MPAVNVGSSGRFYGVDGNWSSIAMYVGTGESASNQLVAFVSTTTQLNIVVSNLACNSDDSACVRNRGGVFTSGDSPTYRAAPGHAFYSTNIESNLVDNPPAGQFGLDQVAVGLSKLGADVSEKHVVAAIVGANTSYYSLFGINPAVSRFPGSNTQYPSLIESLKNAKKIPSLSWGYTAGATYRMMNGNSAETSLVLGGFDSSKFTPNNVSFVIAKSIMYGLTVGIQSITLETGNGAITRILSSPIVANLDSTLPYIWLPTDACDIIANKFSLQWDPSYQLYFISNSARRKILSQNQIPNITFTLGPQLTGGDTVDIKLPYMSFDLKASPPIAPSPKYYFPLKRATSGLQYTLGRTFFQEAYVITNYENGGFTVSQRSFSEASYSSKLVDIASGVGGNSGQGGSDGSGSVTVHKSDDSGSSTSTGAIAGGVVGGIVALAIIAVAIWWFFIRGRRNKGEKSSPDQHSGPPAELHGDPTLRPPEKTKNELEATESRPHSPTHGLSDGRLTPLGASPKNRHTGASPLSSPPLSHHGPGELEGSPPTVFELPAPLTSAYEMPGGPTSPVVDRGRFASTEIENTSPLLQSRVSPSGGSRSPEPLSGTTASGTQLEHG